MTLFPFALLWAAALISAQRGWWPGLLLTVPAATFLVRAFLIQHDCGHGAFFRSRKANDWVGRVLGVFTLTPYDYWKRSHAAHHAGTGNLDSRGLGDLDTLTIAEYRARPPLGRFLYRLYRHPLVLFGIGPAYVFLLKHRWPAGMMKQREPWISAMGTNLAIAAAAAAMSWLVGFEVFLLVHVPMVLVAATLGVWLFYVQHQFEQTIWDKDGEWSFHQAALHGSSYYELPTVLRWITANIGIHHVHHLASRIPFYRLHDTIRDNQALATINRIGIVDSLKLVRLVLWDEQKRRMVTFREAKAAIG